MSSLPLTKDPNGGAAAFPGGLSVSIHAIGISKAKRHFKHIYMGFGTLMFTSSSVLRDSWRMASWEPCRVNETCIFVDASTGVARTQVASA